MVSVEREHSPVWSGSQRFNFHGVKLSWIESFCAFRVLCSQFVTSPLKRCLSGLNFCGMRLSPMATDPQKFNPVKVKAYTVLNLQVKFQHQFARMTRAHNM